MKTVKILISVFPFVLTACQFDGKKSQAPHPHHAAPAGSLDKIVNEKHPLIGEARQITFVGPRSGEGYFSADGTHMIYQSERHDKNPFYQIYLQNLETGKTRLISPGHGKTTCAWIHPSMKKVLYSSTHLDPQVKTKAKAEYESRQAKVKARYSWSYDEHYDIFESDIHGKNIKRLTKEKGYDAEASYSPDGKLIAFASNRLGYTEKLSEEDSKLFEQDPSYMMDIYIMNADGTNVKRLTTSKGYDGGPFFSADGKKITWRRFSPNGSTAEIFTMNIDGTEQRQVTDLKAMSWAPYFHPSGDYIIFGSSILGYQNFELFIVDSLGKRAPVRVTFDEGFDGLPVFTPDGKSLSWTRRNEMGESQIYMSTWDDILARKLLGLSAPQPRAQDFNPEIREADVKEWVSYLASEEFAGRAAGAPAEKVYNQKMVDLLKSWGLQGAGDKGSFVQDFEFTSGVELGQKNTLQFVGSFKKDWVVNKDYLPLSFSKSGVFAEAPLVFVGYGIKAPAGDKEEAYDSYRDVDVAGKWVVVLHDMPQDIPSSRRHYLNTYASIQHKVTVAKTAGAVGLILVNPLGYGEDSLGKLEFKGSLAGTAMAVVKLKTEALKEVFQHAGKDLQGAQKALDKGEATEGFVIPSTYAKAQVELMFTKSKGQNVIAKLPVRGAKSAVLLGAHGDHLGFGQSGSSLAKGSEKGKTHYGADDNASGVAAVLELAHHYAALAKKNPRLLKKEMHFAIWSGEELGNLGSSHYVKSLKKSPEVYINMDMVGRYQDKLFVQGVGSGTHWTQIAEEVSLKTAIPLVLQEDPYLPTDSLAFYMAGVPTLNFFTGSHGEYHSPRDTPETLNYAGLVKVVQVIKSFVDPLVDHTGTLVKYIKVASAQSQLTGRSFRVFVGTIPDYTQEGVKGVKVTGASKDSPAEAAGIKENDVIVEFDGVKIENIYDYVYTLQAVKPNKETIMKILRDGKSLELKVTPKLK